MKWAIFENRPQRKNNHVLQLLQLLQLVFLISKGQKVNFIFIYI